MTFWLTLRRSPYFWAGVFFAVLSILMSIGFHAAGAAPLPIPAHHAQVSLSKGTCSNESMWNTTLSVTADVANGTAHISDAASPWTHSVPFTHTYNISKDTASWPVHVYVTWPDGFKSDTFNLVANRPESGCTPPPTTTPPTTDCAHANPPRDNCGTPTTPPPPTTVPTTTGLCNPPVSTGPGTIVCEPTTTPSSSVPQQPEPTPPTSAQASPSSTAHITLPVTGDDSAPLAGIAAVTALLGAGLVIVTRRRAA